MTTQLKLILENFEETRKEYLQQARYAADKLYANGKKELTGNDIREICPPPANIDPRVMGAIFPRKIWKVISYRPSQRARMRPIAVFTKK